MRKSEILAVLAFLQPEERREVRAKLDQLDGFAPDDWLNDGELSAAEKRLIEERITDLEKHPETSIPWAVAEEELKRRFGS
jgi:hypothetical protein